MRTLASGSIALLACAFLGFAGCKPGGNGRDDSGTISLDGGGTDAVPTGTDAANTDGGIPWPDAGDFDAWAPPPDPGDSGTSLFDGGVTFGPAVIVNTMALAPGTEGFDLDGDLTNDNQLVEAGGGIIGMFGDMIQTAIDDGTILLLLEFRGVEDPLLLGDDLTMDAAMYNGVDTDTDPMNNFDPAFPEDFLVDPASLDPMGYPMILFFNTSITGAPAAPLFQGERNSLPFTFPGLGSLMLVNPRIEGNPSANFYDFSNGLLGGVIQACALDQIPSPLGAGGTVLELLLQFAITPDIDLSGDGLETFQLSSGFPSTIVSCTDGDGTVIPNLATVRCACDERIEDGVSMALQFTAVSANITGVGP